MYYEIFDNDLISIDLGLNAKQFDGDIVVSGTTQNGGTNFTETKDDILTEGTWHIYESDLCGDHSIVKKAIEGEFCDDDVEVKLYQENGKQINGDESHGLFVAYQGGVPV